MNIRPLVAAIALLLAGIPALSFGQSSSGPVSIVQSNVQPATVGGDRNGPGLVNVTFVNHRATPAVRVSFSLMSNGARLASLHATGTFSPGVSISKTFQTHAIERDQEIAVSSVTFADGSKWQSPTVDRGTVREPPFH